MTQGLVILMALTLKEKLKIVLNDMFGFERDVRCFACCVHVLCVEFQGIEP